MTIQTTLIEERQRTLDETPLDPFTLAAQVVRLRSLDDGMHSDPGGGAPRRLRE